MASTSPRRSKLLVGLFLITGLYWLAMFTGTHIPIRMAPAGNPYSLDKLEHVVAFAGLAALVCGIGTAQGVASTAWYLGAMGLIAGYGIVDEATQALVAYREPSLLDWLADLVGAGMGTAAVAIGRRLMVSGQRRAT